MKIKTAIIIIVSVFVFGLVSLGVAYQIRKSQLVNVVSEPVQEPIIPVKVLSNDEKSELGKARAAELLRMMDNVNNASSTPLTEAEKAAKIKAGEERAAALLKMMK